MLIEFRELTGPEHAQLTAFWFDDAVQRMLTALLNLYPCRPPPDAINQAITAGRSPPLRFMPVVQQLLVVGVNHVVPPYAWTIVPSHSYPLIVCAETREVLAIA